MKDLGRAIRYLGRYRSTTTLAYASLFISIGAQLVVPQLVQNILDAVTESVFARQILDLPKAARAAALESLSLSLEELTERAVSAEGPIFWAMVFIVVFSLARRAVRLRPGLPGPEGEPGCRLRLSQRTV